MQSSIHRTTLFSKFDKPLYLALILYLFFSFLLLASSHSLSYGPIVKQFAIVLFSSVILLAISHCPTALLEKHSHYFYGSSIFLLIMVLLLGSYGKGATRWLHLGFIKFQPSELIKISLPCFLAQLLCSSFKKPWLRYLLCLFAVALPFLLIAKQPDLGTAVLVASIGFFSVYVSGISMAYPLYIGIFITLLSPAVWFRLLHDYQKKRIITLFFPSSDLSGMGYHSLQAKIAIGSGGFFGKGWLQGTQSQLHYLPEHHTDFIFALCAEEFGLFGCLILIGILLFMITRLLFLSYHAVSTYGKILTASVAFYLAVCSFINMAMVSGLIPITGIPLPLISQGGTTVLVTFLALGLTNAFQK